MLLNISSADSSKHFSQILNIVIFMSISENLLLLCSLLFLIEFILRNAPVLGEDGSKRLQIEILCPYASDVQIPIMFDNILLVQFFTVIYYLY